MFAEKDMIVATSSRAPYVEIDEKAMECSFKSLEFVNVMYVKEGSKIPMPKLSKVTHLGIRQMPGKGARAGKGLGKKLQGMLKPIIVIQKKDRFGLRYIKGERGRGSSRRRDRTESLASSKKRKKAQK